MTRPSPFRAPLLALGALLLLGSAPSGALAQQLGEIEVLARDGRITQARAALTEWWDAEWSDASRDDRQQALWLRGVLTLDPTQAASQFRRLAVQYPGGEWTARALLRLARTALLEDDLITAARYFEDLRRDYPASAARLEAVEWLDANGDRVTEARRVRDAERAGEPPSADAPTAGRAGDDPPAGSGDAAIRTDAPPQDSPPATPPRGDFGVQIGAFSSVDRAESLAADVRDAGFEPRLVRIPDSGLIRVRVGVFEDAVYAENLYDRIVAAGFEAAVVQDVAREEPIG